jgi:hypothetical protein
MIRLGFVGGAGIYHAKAFAGLINDHDPAAWRSAGLPVFDQQRLSGAQVAAIWDSDTAAARWLADMAGIPEVLGEMEDMIGRVDGVLVLDDMTLKHQSRARPFLSAGVPTFIDKPLSPDPAEAADLVALARESGAPMMSCSALRYSRELAEVRADLAAIGPIVQATGTGPNELIFYGVHPLELAYAVMGPGVEWVQNTGDETNALVRCVYPDGRAIVLQVLGKAQPGLQAAFFGERGWRLVEVRDVGYYSHSMLTEFVSMVRTGIMPIPLDHTLEIVEILAAGKRSRQEGGSRVHLGLRRGPQRSADNDKE